MGYITFIDSGDCLDRFFLQNGMSCAAGRNSDVIQFNDLLNNTIGAFFGMRLAYPNTQG